MTNIVGTQLEMLSDSWGGQGAGGPSQEMKDWPPDFKQRYIDEGYWQPETFIDVIRRSAQQHAGRMALRDGERSLSYAELLAQVQRLAGGFRRLGWQRGDAVILQLPNSFSWLLCCLAMFQLGVRPVMALPVHRERELSGFARYARPRAYIGAAGTDSGSGTVLARNLREACPELAQVILDGRADALAGELALQDLLEAPPYERVDALAHDVACFQLSGGTTGVPKLIPRRHDEYLYNLRAAVAASGLTGDSIYLVCLPMPHNFVLCCPGVLGALTVGATVVVARQPDAVSCLRLIARERVTHVALVPPAALLWMEAQRVLHEDLTSLQLLQVGGAKLMSSAAERIGPELGCELQQVFGMAEGLICCTRIGDSAFHRHQTQGRPLSPADEIRIVDEHGQPVPAGVAGELQVRGPYTIRSYYARPDQQATSFTEDGFYCSGDVVRQLPDGYLVVEGRQKDQINRGGEKLSVDEVEDVLMGHPQVLDVAVVARADAWMGERAHAFVIPRGTPPSVMSLRRYLAEQGLAGFKCPDQFEFLDRFPETGIGKTSKRHLREVLGAALRDRPPLPKGVAS
jgi:salicylate---[aryl-carrier protein] ligase